MNILIIKLGATGDVVRTTPLLRRLDGVFSWITAAVNLPLLQGIDCDLRCASWENRYTFADTAYDLVINLEDEVETSLFAQQLKFKQIFGAYITGGKLTYTADSSGWFDLSLISTHGPQEADRLKLANRRTYQELIFGGLGFNFAGEEYCLPQPQAGGLKGDLAISATAGSVWPMKKWAYYEQLQHELESRGVKVNVLNKRPSLLEHLADVQGHRCLISGDSLPMHLALGSGVRCVSIFTCTSPWEIYSYGLQEKIISPLLQEFFYKRGYYPRATEAIPVESVVNAVIRQLDTPGGNRPTDPASAANSENQVTASAS